MVGIDGNYSNYNYLSIELISSCFMALNWHKRCIQGSRQAPLLVEGALAYETVDSIIVLNDGIYGVYLQDICIPRRTVMPECLQNRDTCDPAARPVL